MWSPVMAGDAFELERSFNPGVKTISLIAEGWRENSRESVHIGWRAAADPVATPAPIPVSWSDDRAVATVTAPDEGGATFILRAPMPAERILWRTTDRARAPIPWSEILPLGLDPEATGRFANRPRTGSRAPGTLLSADELEGALDTFALSSLRGSREDALADAKALLQSLARQPFLRSPMLGAFVAALYDEIESR